MPQYLGEEVGQEFLDMIMRVYKEQHEAEHADHIVPPTDDVGIVALCEAAQVRGGPDAAALGRKHAVDPPVAP